MSPCWLPRLGTGLPIVVNSSVSWVRLSSRKMSLPPAKSGLAMRLKPPPDQRPGRSLSGPRFSLSVAYGATARNEVRFSRVPACPSTIRVLPSISFIGFPKKATIQDGRTGIDPCFRIVTLRELQRGSGSRGGPWPRELQGAQDRARGGGAVERVEVDARGAAREQLRALQGCVGDPEVPHRLLLAGALAQLAVQALRDRGAAHAAHALHLADVGDRQDAGDDWHLDPCGARAREEVEVEGGVEEQLGDQEVRPRAHLLGEVREIVLGTDGVDVRLWEARRPDCEWVVGSDQRHQFGGVLEAPLGLRPALLARGRVAAQREHVLDPGLPHLMERGVELRHG